MESGDPKTLDQMATRARSRLDEISALRYGGEIPPYDAVAIRQDPLDLLAAFIEGVESECPRSRDLSREQWRRSALSAVASAANKWFKETGENLSLQEGQLESLTADDRVSDDVESLVLWALGVGGLPKERTKQIRDTLAKRATRAIR